MADVVETATYADAATAISQGKRHLLVQDYTAAVTAFAEGLEMMSQKMPDCDDQLGEPYLLYGRALLGLAREEAGVLGGGVIGSEEAEEDEDAEDEDEKMSEGDDKEEEVEETDEKTSKSPSKTDTDSKKEDKVEEKPEKDVASNETDDKKAEEQKLDKSSSSSSGASEKVEKSDVVESNVAGSSKVHTNGKASSAEASCNGGTAGKSDLATVEEGQEEEEEEDVNKEDDEEDPGRGIDLQVAWEVLELAKIVFAKRGETGLKNLAETHRLLGEVAMESDNPQGAIDDLEGALKLLQKMEPCEPRAIAELHYQLGLAHSLLNDFDASIGQFKEATTLLEARIKQLEAMKEPTKIDDPFYTVEGEIKELNELLPAIQEKITDMKDFKEEACRLVIEGIKNKVAGGGCSNGAAAGSSSGSDAGASSSSAQQSSTMVSPKNTKPASDISHLVRKKRKADEPESPAASPCKKPTP